MGFAMGSTGTHLLPSHSSSSSTSSSFFHSHSVLLRIKNCNAESKKKKRATATVACIRQEEPDDIVFSKKRAVLFVGISVLPLLQLRARALQKGSEDKTPEDNKREELAIEKYRSPNPFVSLLNGLGIFGTGVLGALYALSQKEKKATEATIESMTAKLNEKEAAIVSLEKNFESKLLNEREEGTKQLRKVKEEQQVLMNQLNSANSTIAGLGQELKNEKRIIDELNIQVDVLQANLSKAQEDKKALDQELKEKLNSMEVLQDKINLLSIELKEKEHNVQNLTSSVAEKELELNNMNSTYKETKDELAKAQRDINALRDELLKNRKELESKNSVVDELNSMVSCLMVEKDESDRKLTAFQEEYNDLKSSSEKKADLDAKLLAEREDELHQLKEKLERALNEVSGNQVMITDLTQEREDLRNMLDKELNNAMNLKHEVLSTQEALGKLRNEAAALEKELKQSRCRCMELEAEISRVQTEFAEVTETMQKSLERAKQSGEALANEITAVKEQLRKSKDELQMVSHELETVIESRGSVQKELVDAYNKAEVAANELREEKKVVVSLKKEKQDLEEQSMEDKDARKSLETDLEEATKSLDEMNRNALILSGELEIANSRILSLEEDKQVLYKSLTKEKNASKEARENMEDAHNVVLKLGKERESLEKRARTLEEELASAKGEILRLRSQINSSKALANKEQSQKGEAEDKVTVTAKNEINSSKTVSNEQPSQRGESENKVTVTAKNQVNSSKTVANEQPSKKGETKDKVTVTAKRGGRRRRSQSQ